MYAMAKKTEGGPVSSAFAANLRRLREDAGMTQEQLAERVDLSRLSIMKLEGGTSEPRGSTVSRIAAVFGVTRDDLYREPAKPTQAVC